MNSLSFDGRVAADAELKYTPAGEPVLQFRVASDIGYGERKTTNWFACQVWGKRGESLQPFLTKGQQVTVYGQLTLREWTDKEGGKRLSPDVRVLELSLQGGKREDDAPPAGSAPSSHEQPARTPRPDRPQQVQQRPGLDDDDYPF